MDKNKNITNIINEIKLGGLKPSYEGYRYIGDLNRIIKEYHEYGVRKMVVKYRNEENNDRKGKITFYLESGEIHLIHLINNKLL